jgi:hypothetical protein
MYFLDGGNSENKSRRLRTLFAEGCRVVPRKLRCGMVETITPSPSSGWLAGTGVLCGCCNSVLLNRPDCCFFQRYSRPEEKNSD